MQLAAWRYVKCSKQLLILWMHNHMHRRASTTDKNKKKKCWELWLSVDALIDAQVRSVCTLQASCLQNAITINTWIYINWWYERTLSLATLTRHPMIKTIDDYSRILFAHAAVSRIKSQLNALPRREKIAKQCLRQIFSHILWIWFKLCNFYAIRQNEAEHRVYRYLFCSK